MKLAICAIAKDEGMYLPEWFMFHRLQGVTHFFLYDNNSTDNTAEICTLNCDVTRIPWSQHPGQVQAYNDSILRAAEFEWLAFIDCDEFLYGLPSLSVALPTLDGRISAIEVHPWRFGSDNKLTRNCDLVISRFLKRAATQTPNPKSIGRVSRIKRVIDSHLIETSGIHIGTPTIHINHYQTKSKEEYRIRCDKGRADVPYKRDFEGCFKKYNSTDIWDPYVAQEYSDKIKTALNDCN